MATQEYKENQSLRSMNTRQLRLYISDQAEEAQARIDSVKGKTSEAFDELLFQITDRSHTKVLKSTSYLTKAEMMEKAYMLRMFNKFDTESKYAQKTDWERNRKRYETFVLNQIATNTKEGRYWKKFYNEKTKHVSKRGYQEYKDLISVLKASEDYIKSFNYRNIQQYAQKRRNDLDPGNKILNRTMAKIYRENKGKGLTQAQMFNLLKREYDDILDDLEAAKQTKKTTPIKATTKKPKKTKSKSNVKTKTVGKMRTSGKVRNKLT